MTYRICFLLLFILVADFLDAQIIKDKSTLAGVSVFDQAEFVAPSKEFAPYARWWWPGNDVQKEELKREVELFANNGFGGVEIQPLNIGLPMDRITRSKILSWDTPEYYENLKVVLEEARKYGLIVDLTNGSGWPPGGEYLDLSDGFLSLNYTDTLIEGKQSIQIHLPTLEKNFLLPAKLQAVLAVKVKPRIDNDNNATVPLEASSIQDLSKIVETDVPGGDVAAGSTVINEFGDKYVLNWDVPAGNWKIIAFWAVPSGERTMIAASPKQGPVVDHLDSLKVLKSYNHLLGDRTGLEPYYGNPIRAIFNDSYEFKANRHFSFDFFSWFKEHRGYDIVPWLPANMQKGYNMVEFMNPHADPDFSFSDEDWRLRYDYDLTIGELLGEHFFKTTQNYFKELGLVHRTQPYGLNMDMMALAGMASIPETESMNGSEAKLKLTTSGGHLYNRPIISAESVVFINKAYTTTPQMIRLAVDKLFAAGVNQVIYHGTPYCYKNEKLGEQGWYPFSSPLLPYVNFASNLGESNPYWKFQKEINKYITRTQYLLRLGKPVADVLIYYPFLNFSGMADNPNEIFTAGTLEKEDTGSETPKDPQAKIIKEWSKKIWPLINALDENGITWEWVNDASIQVAELTVDKQINVRGNLYRALILPEIPFIQLKSAEQINDLAEKGLNLLVMGDVPAKQPSFYNWQENDMRTKEFVEASLLSSNTSSIRLVADVYNWIEKIQSELPVKFNKKYDFIRQSQRELTDKSRLYFIWNTTDSWQEFSLSLDNRFDESYWLDSENGEIKKNLLKGNASIVLPPFGTKILFAGTKSLSQTEEKEFKSLCPLQASQVLTLEKWSLKSDSLSVDNSPLFDWKMNEDWKYSSKQGIYRTSFRLAKLNPNKKYLLDLGEVNYTAEVQLNGQPVGTRLYLPYVFDISPYLKEGENYVEIKVIPTPLNHFIGRANAGEKEYRQFKGKDKDLMSQGILGPVILYEKLE